MADKQLTAAPALLPMYVRAMLAGKGRRGDALPDSVYTLADQAIDAEHLARYQRVCGFRVADELPSTYLHLLAFPLSVALMSEPGFPFPLVGLVHVENSIAVGRAVLAGETVSLRIRADGLRPHPSGQQFDLLAEVRARGERVWSARSTYLHREAASGPREPRRPRPPQAEQAGAVALVRVPEDIGRKYGAVSGDRNPIHIHTLTAKAFGYPSAIAHGMWLKARTLATLEGRLPPAYTVDVAFKTPVYLPSTIAIATERAGEGWALDVHGAPSGKPHLTGTLRPNPNS